MPGPSKSNPTRTSDPIQSDRSEVQPMDMEPYGPQLPPRPTQKPHSECGVHSDPDLDHLEQASDSEYYQDLNTKNTLTRGNVSPNPSTNLSHLQRMMSSLPIPEGLHNPNLRFLQNLNLRPAQIQSSIGR